MSYGAMPSRLRSGDAGLLFLLVASVGWGLNWPALKMLLAEWPPQSARGAFDGIDRDAARPAHRRDHGRLHSRRAVWNARDRRADPDIGRRGTGGAQGVTARA